MTDNVYVAWLVAIFITYLLVTPVLLLVFRIGNREPFSTGELLARIAWPVAYPVLAGYEVARWLRAARRWFVLTDAEHRDRDRERFGY